MTYRAPRALAAAAALAAALAAGPAYAADGAGGAPATVPKPAPKPAESSAADIARQALIERLKGAAAAGIVAFPALPAADTGESANDTAPARTPFTDPSGPHPSAIDESAAAAAMPGADPDPAPEARPDRPACREDAAIAAALTAPGGTLPPLAGEFDRIDPAAVDAHVRAALAWGLGAEALFLLRAFPEAQPAEAALYRDLGAILDHRPAAASALVRASGCTGLHALMQAAAHAGAGEAASSAAAAMRAGDAAARLSPVLRAELGPQVVVAALDAGDTALGQTLAAVLLDGLPAGSGWMRLARARLDAAAGQTGTARDDLLGLAESQHPAAVPAALAAARLTPAGDPAEVRLQDALDRVVHLMRHRPEGREAAELRARRLIDAGTPVAALDLLSRAPAGAGTDALRLAALDAIAAGESLPAAERAVLLYTHLAALPDATPGIADTLTHAAWLFAGLAQPAIAAGLDARRARIAGDAPVLTAEEASSTAGADAAQIGSLIDMRTQTAAEAVTGDGLPGLVRTALARARATESAIREVQRP
ncbi:hypothetical protein [Futiania mangrovi]|uniref:Antifreeze glycopeptide polyprotein n=1 Tax=Futiania mangrovi TaxID=2959716 RepID=A0A9J6PG84_9PROT|nr:hypothetical protein [Futiania mangrovii]MCP1336832.1 hypothetical protein [Futiania mangrovii]